jgi:hypothetical protein
MSWFLQGNYTVQSFTSDFSALSVLPLEGFTWKLKQINTYGPYQEPLYCIDIETTVILVNQNRRKNKKIAIIDV